MEQKYYHCKQCGKIISIVKNSACPTICCGNEMPELEAGVVEAAKEKHIPVYTVDGNKVSVTVGEVEHPMLDTHDIEWVVLKTKEGSQMKTLNPGEAPKVEFMLSDGDKVEEVYAYCNLHGLWKAKA